MFKGKFVALTLIAAILLSWQVASVDNATSGVVQPCSSTAVSLGGCMFNCPQGDGVRFDSFGGTISITVKDITGAPIAGIPATDFWADGCGGNVILCGGSGSSNANAATDANGQTEMVGTMAAGGCDQVGLAVVVQGVVLLDPGAACLSPLCLNFKLVSPDIDGNNVVNLADFSVFGAGYTSPPKPYNPCIDYNCDGVVNLADFSRFASHYLHQC